MLRASLRSCLRMRVGPMLALPGPTFTQRRLSQPPLLYLRHAPGVASLLPPHACRPDAGASRADVYAASTLAAASSLTVFTARLTRRRAASAVTPSSSPTSR